MKKYLALTAAMLLIVPVLAMAGMTAFDNMTELGDEMAEVTGQVGITIDSSVRIDDGFFAWTDADGWGTTGQAGASGSLYLDNLRVYGNTGTTSFLEQNGLKIDAGTDTGGTTYLCITLPRVQGVIEVGSIGLGTNQTVAAANSLGSIMIGDLDMAGSTLKISAH